ncbi:hypothetical protein CEP52_010761 [Fusarium oligoseptatum]|uniref:Uncharacterized protein n=2 Tax=Fusarium solani species complex TaxID=232080 RepID=A0A428T6N2_9HYPO|nr:hypothetical protein CDV31_014535 [Fusarium ambrosium]RSL97699.1 hypothetical protein CEP52_010761 [Fusarium oligoseptatum]
MGRGSCRARRSDEGTSADVPPYQPAIQQYQLPVRVEWEVTSSFVQFPEGRATGQSRAGLPRLAPPSGCWMASQWPFGVGAREQFRDLTCSSQTVESISATAYLQSWVDRLREIQ